MKLLTCLLFIFATAMATPIDINEFFQGKDSSSLKWAHAVNSNELLDKAMKDTSLNMIEADVRMGKVKSPPTSPSDAEDKEIPIMAHDDAESDLSLEEFLNKVKTQKKVGIKLDFKDIAAYNAIDEKFQAILNALEVPVLLNADVVVGPGKEPKKAVEIAKIAEIEGVLYSLGWTTGDFIEDEPVEPVEPDAEEEKINEYTLKHLRDMNQYLLAKKFVGTKITFPVRAMFLSRNVNVFKDFLKDAKHSLTVWSGKDDDKHIKIPELSNFLLENAKKVFVDIPASVQTAIDKERNSGTSVMPMAATILAFIAFVINYFK